MGEKLVNTSRQVFQSSLSTLEYIFSREFIRLAITVVLATILLVYLLFFYVFLPVFTKHGEEVQVPVVTGISLQAAHTRLEEAGLDYEIKDSIYAPNSQPLAINQQFPLPGRTVKPGRKIQLTVNMKHPPLVYVPKLTDKSLSQARILLKRQKLAIDAIRYIPGNVDAADEVILYMMYNGRKLTGGEEIPQGSGIDLYISKGIQEALTANPSLSGLSWEVAEYKLRSLNLIAIPVYNAPAKPEGIVYHQDPPENDSLRQGSVVTVYIGGQIPQESPEGNY